MTETYRPRVKYVIGPDGSPLTIADLPPVTHAEMGHPAKGGSRRSRPRGAFIFSTKPAAAITLTVDEFLSWQMSIDQHGLAGLRTTRLQQYRA